jgi:hypothetical protein
MSYDALVITAHPDDAETQMGGTLAKLAEGGQRILLVDLTEGEPSDFAPRGERARQAAEAARILGVERLTLGHQDRFLADDQGLRLEVAALIREHRPRTVAKWVIGLLLLMMGARLLIFVLAAAGLINWGGFTGTSWLWIMPVLMVLMMGLMFFVMPRGIVILLASAGWLMAPVGPLIPLVLLVAVAIYALAMDSVKMGLFRRLHLHEV